MSSMLAILFLCFALLTPARACTGIERPWRQSSFGSGRRACARARALARRMFGTVQYCSLSRVSFVSLCVCSYVMTCESLPVG